MNCDYIMKYGVPRTKKCVRCCTRNSKKFENLTMGFKSRFRVRSRGETTPNLDKQQAHYIPQKIDSLSSSTLRCKLNSSPKSPRYCMGCYKHLLDH